MFIRKNRTKSKNKFKKIGASQKKEIIQASIRDITKNLMNIDDSMIKIFVNESQKLIEEFGSENTVTRLLAYSSGNTDKMKSRSLLCGAEGWITYSIKVNNKFQHDGYVWSFFKRLLKEEIKNKIRGMRLMKSMDGCVFDYPEEGHEIFEEILYNDRLYGRNYTLEIIEDLPDLQGIDEQKNNNNINNVNGFRPKKETKILDHSKYSKKAGKIDLFVGNLPYNIDEVMFREWFEKNGLKNIEFDARLVIDKETGQPRGFGFVSVFDKNDVNSVLKLNKKEFNKRKLIINESKK